MAGFTSLSTLICIHHANVFLFMRNWTYVIFIFCAISVLFFMPIGIFRDTKRSQAYMYKEAWTQSLDEPQYWLCMLIATAMVIIP